MATLLCRVQFLDDTDPFNSTNFPEPTRPPLYTFRQDIPLGTQLPGVHRLLRAPHKVTQRCGDRGLASGRGRPQNAEPRPRGVPLAAEVGGLGTAEPCGALRAQRLQQGLWWLQGCGGFSAAGWRWWQPLSALTCRLLRAGSLSPALYARHHP